MSWKNIDPISDCPRPFLSLLRYVPSTWVSEHIQVHDHP